MFFRLERGNRGRGWNRTEPDGSGAGVCVGEGVGEGAGIGAEVVVVAGASVGPLPIRTESWKPTRQSFTLVRTGVCEKNTPLR